MLEILASATDWLKKNCPHMLALYSFGSVGTEFEKKDSDIDLGILFARGLDKKERLRLEQELSVFLSRDVDLVDINNASTVFQYQIISTGQRLFCSHQQKADAFEALVVTYYLRLNEERKDILDDIKKRGSVL